MKKNSNLLVLVLTIGVFGIMNTEMGIIGILPVIAQNFDVSVPTAGLLVSAFALIVAFAGPTMPLIFSKINRKTVMLLALTIFTTGNLISMFAPNFTVLMIARVIPAAFHPIYVSLALTVAGSSVKPEESAKAVSKVFIGVSAGMVLGVPVTSFIATEISFSASMLFFAIVNGAILIATMLFIPSMPVKETLSYGKQIGVLKKPTMIIAIIIGILLNGAIFGFYSYMSDFLETITNISTRSISVILLVYGLTNIIGNLIAGKTLTANSNKTILVLPFSLIISYVVLFITGQFAWSTIIVISIVGILAGISANANQFIINHAGLEAPDFSNGLFLTAANLGTTFGTFFCGLFISSFDSRYTLLGSLLFLVLAIFAILLRSSLIKKAVY